MTDEIKVELQAAHLNQSTPASDTKSQAGDSARAQSRSVNPTEQLRVTLSDFGNFDEFKRQLPCVRLM